MLVHWTQNDLFVNGVRLHYYRSGHGDKPALVFVHGFSDNGLCWTPVARDLEAEYDVIMPDMRGHGLSERVQLSDKVDMAADVAELIRMLGLTRPIEVGHSMGAMITYQIGVRFPELASALVLEDPPWWLSPRGERLPPSRPAENPIAQWAKSLSNQTLEALLAQYRKEHPNWPEALLRPMCESKKATRSDDCRYHDRQDALPGSKLADNYRTYCTPHVALRSQSGAWRDSDPRCRRESS